MKPPAMVLCTPETSTPGATGSTRERCIECGIGVWVSPATRLLACDRRLFFLCVPCGPSLADPGVELVVEPATTEQLRELDQAFG